jgi:glycosyltransferase involved in cell wall biosynthesis
MSKIKILAIPSDSFGVGKFRMLDPYKFIGDNYTDEIHVDIIHNVQNVDDVFKDYNIVIFHSFIHQQPHEINIERIKWLKTKGIKVIMDIDDLWQVDHRHPLYYHILKEKIGDKKIEMLKLVDYVTTTTPIFAKTINEKLGVKNVEIFPNAINPEEKQFQPNPISSDKIRFGWLGGSTHLHDLDLLRNGISSLHYSHNGKVQFVLCGFDLRGTMTEVNKMTGEVVRRDIKPMETVWYEYEKIFTDNYGIIDENYKNFLLTFIKTDQYFSDKPYVRRWTEDVSEYGKNYNYFDVSLVPLVENIFNTNKSQLKVIESGFHKKAIIANESLPYTLDLTSAITDGKFNDKGNALFVSQNKNHKQWAQQMKRLVDNPNMIKDLGERLYETVKDKYSLQKVCKDRVEFLKSII